MGQQSSRQLTTWSWYKPSLAKLYEIVLLARSSLFVQLFLKLHLSNHIPSNRLKSELPTHCHVKTCHTQTHEAYVFLAVKVGSEMDQFGKVKHFGFMQLNIPVKELIWWKIFNIFLCNSRFNFISNHSWDSFREMGCREYEPKKKRCVKNTIAYSQDRWFSGPRLPGESDLHGYCLGRAHRPSERRFVTEVLTKWPEFRPLHVHSRRVFRHGLTLWGSAQRRMRRGRMELMMQRWSDM